MISKLAASLLDLMDIVEIVRFVNEGFSCITIFNMELWRVYYRIFSLLCLRKKFLTVGGKLERLPYGDEAFVEVRTVVKVLDRVGDKSHQIVNDFNMSSKVADDLRFKLSKSMLVSNMLKEELANLETKMEVLGDA